MLDTVFKLGIASINMDLTEMKKHTLAAIAASVLFATAASAADLPARTYTKAPAIAAPIFSWTGFYVGVNAGGGWNDTTGDHFCTNPAGVVGGIGCSSAVNGTLKPSGGLAGGQIGYNWQTGSLVLGAEADIQWSGIKASSSFPVPCCNGFAPDPNIRGASSQELRWFGTVRGRLGVAVAERGLLYGTAGLIYGEEAVAVALMGGINYAAAASSTRTGWTAGGGFEYAFTNNLTGKVEGLYYDMGKQTISFTSPFTGYTVSGGFQYTGVMARAGLNWKFGGPVVARY
jgi:outer membrane immunogenic protein